MCARTTMKQDPAALAAYLDGMQPGLAAPAGYRPRYNIAPTQQHFILTGGPEQIASRSARWGLVNSWAKDAKRAARQINARIETAAGSRAYARAFKRRRCAVPFDGWYEWSGPKSARQPHWIHRGDESPFLFAGLWELWTPPDGAEPLATFTILTAGAAARLQPIHDRMPVVLPEDRAAEWVDPALDDPDRALRLLADVNMDAFTVRAVSTRVNYVQNDAPDLIEEIDAAEIDAVQPQALKLL